MKSFVWIVCCIVASLFSTVETIDIGHCSRLKEIRCRPFICSKNSPRNLIIMYEPFGAGLKDRNNVVNRAIYIGAFLCAKVIIPPPYMMLSHYHNQGRMDCNWQWSRYWDMPSYYPLLTDWFALKSSSSFSQSHSSLPITSPQVCSDQLQCKPSTHCRNKTSVLQDLILFVEKQGYEVVYNIEDALETYMGGSVVPFALPIIASNMFNKTFRATCLPLFRDQSDSHCSHLDLEERSWLLPAKAVSEVAEDVIGSLESSEYLLVHLRRGDTLSRSDKCDNSPLQINFMLKCKRSGSGKFKLIVYSTDDRNPKYLKQAEAVMRSHSELAVVGLDVLVKNKLLSRSYKDADNYLVYQVLEEIKRLSPSDAVVEFGGHSKDTGAKCREMTKC